MEQDSIVVSERIWEWKELIPKNQIFEGIHGHSTVLYKGGLWLYGGMLF